jgi:hypothetical protein
LLPEVKKTPIAPITATTSGSNRRHVVFLLMQEFEYNVVDVWSVRIHHKAWCCSQASLLLAESGTEIRDVSEQIIYAKYSVKLNQAW